MLAVLTLLMGLASSIATQVAAHASVAVGDFVYTDRTSSDTKVMLHTSGGATTLADAGGNPTSGSGGYGMAAPAISPDGSKVVFSMYDCNLNTGDSCFSTVGQSQVLVVVNSDGSNATEITQGTSSQGVVDWEPTWSPDGSWIAFERVTGSSKGIFKIHADGSGLTQLISDSNPSNDYQGLVWSPDGTKFAYAHYNTSTFHMELRYSNTDGSGETVISNQPSPSTTDNSMPAWAPNSSRVYFQSLHSGTATIQGINLDGSSLQQETNGGSVQYPSVSADGSTLIVSAGSSYTDLFTVPTDGSKTQTTVTSDGSTYIHEWPAFVNGFSPSWWSGTMCDTAHNSGSAPLKHSGITTSFDGVTACGGGSSISTTFGGESVSENEWQCTELVLRYMDLRWGVQNYVADGYQIVSNYSGSIMTKVTNTGSNLPAVGDVISFNRVSPYDTTHGHTAIVTAVNVTGGSGTITTMEQNNGSTGVGSVTVSGSGISTTIVNGWLHHS